MAAIGKAAAAKALVDAFRGASGPDGATTGTRLKALPRMLRQGMTGRYPYLDKRRLGLSVVAVLYVLSPVDFIPELFFSVLGLGDDALVFAWLAGTVLSEADAFLTWEAERKATVPGEVLH